MINKSYITQQENFESNIGGINVGGNKDFTSENFNALSNNNQLTFNSNINTNKENNTLSKFNQSRNNLNSNLNNKNSSLIELNHQREKSKDSISLNGSRTNQNNTINTNLFNKKDLRIDDINGDRTADNTPRI